MKYWAFLSYSHTDKKWGDWLHKALETIVFYDGWSGKNRAMGKFLSACSQSFVIATNLGVWSG